MQVFQSASYRQMQDKDIKINNFDFICGSIDKNKGILAKGLIMPFEKNIEKRFGKIILDNNLWIEAIELSEHPDHRVAFRASWALEWAYFAAKEKFAPHLNIFFDKYYTGTNPSVHRHYAKILYNVLKDFLDITDVSLMERIAEKTFDLFIDEETKVAVKVWAMEILFLLSEKIEWVEENFEDTLRYQLILNPSPAMVNHANKVLKRLNLRKLNNIQPQ